VPSPAFATSLAANVAWSPSPLGVEDRPGIWARSQPRHAAANRAVRLVPADAAVSTSAHLAPHLTHRVHIYEFPNPWVTANWGLRGENPADPATIDYLVVDIQRLGVQRRLYERLVGPDKEFRVVFAKDGIVVARRALPPGPLAFALLDRLATGSARERAPGAVLRCCPREHLVGRGAT
jgi:Predicted membrane protein (DUF2079)